MESRGDDMKNPFRYYTTGATFVIEDRRLGSEAVASGVSRAYVHRIVDLLNADAARRREPSVHELLRAYE